MQKLQDEEIDAAVVEQRAAEEVLVNRAVALCARKLVQRENLKQEVACLIAAGDARRTMWSHDFHDAHAHQALRTAVALKLTPMSDLTHLPKTLHYDATCPVLDNIRACLPTGYDLSVATDGSCVRVTLWAPTGSNNNGCVVS